MREDSQGWHHELFALRASVRFSYHTRFDVDAAVTSGTCGAEGWGRPPLVIGRMPPKLSEGAPGNFTQHSNDQSVFAVRQFPLGTPHLNLMNQSSVTS